MDGLATKVYKALLRAIWHLKIMDIWWKSLQWNSFRGASQGSGLSVFYLCTFQKMSLAET